MAAPMRLHDPTIVRVARWWNPPATATDRFNGAICAGVAGLWLGAFGRIALASSSASLTDIALCAALGIAVGIVVGRRFPRASVLIFSPFTLFGISPGS
ncbi:MAG TPA: hypothetical protein VGC55_04120 [Dokdonella sp.]